MAASSSAVRQFLSQQRFIVVGASANRGKFGNKVLRCYLQHARRVVAVNPKAARARQSIEGVPTFASLTEAHRAAEEGEGEGHAGTEMAVSVITPPAQTEAVVQECVSLGLTHCWLQPGAESANALRVAQDAGLDVIAGGPCVLAMLGYDDAWVPEETVPESGDDNGDGDDAGSGKAS